ncbi:putative DSBA-like thioredoxin domain, Thioredoxin-like superfamily [Helianthus annuus]|nr:putative DSBA-like thioredoxin domain, Thioredoxin-like superfamily [Helianthus annuus]
MNRYFTQGKFIGDKDFLVESATKVGLEGAIEFLQAPNNGLQEVNEELGKYAANISGVPHYVINGKYQLTGGQPAEVFLRAFQVAAICRNGGLGGVLQVDLRRKVGQEEDDGYVFFLIVLRVI